MFPGPAEGAPFRIDKRLGLFGGREASKEGECGGANAVTGCIGTEYMLGCI